MTATFERIRIDRIEPHPRNIRRDVGSTAELAASIEGQRLLQPLVVAPIPLTAEEASGSTLPPQRYVLIAGHRRHAAAQQAGLTQVPCIVRDDLTTQKAQIEAMLVENLQRTDLTVMEEADAYAQLELLGVKEAGIAKATGRSKATVHQRLLLAGLPTARREEVEEGRLSLEGAVKCARLRAQYVDDAEVLTTIDGAGVWAFSGGIERRIQHILDERRRASQPPADIDDGDDDAGLDFDGQRNEREAARDAEREARERASVVKQAGLRAQHTWLLDLILAGGDGLPDQVTRYALEYLADQDDVDPVLLALGAPQVGPDDDYDDHHARVIEAVNGWPIERARLAVALIGSTMMQRSTWEWETSTLMLVEHLGYVPTADECGLLAGGE